MHFLCLHGWGTNSEVFELQTATLRYELVDNHTYEFVEGTCAWPIAPEIRSYFPADKEYFAYFDPSSAKSCCKAVDDLEVYITSEGPFDGVIAFSQGASLAATMMLRNATGTQAQSLEPPSKCAIFLSAAIPLDFTSVLQDHVQEMDPDALRDVINIPTAHIWGQDDKQYRSMCEEVSRIWQNELRTDFIHAGGHEVPSSGAKDAVISAVNAIRRAVTKGLTAQ